MKSLKKINVLVAVTILSFVSTMYASPVIYHYNTGNNYSPAWAVAPSANDLLQTNLDSYNAVGNFNTFNWTPQGAAELTDGDTAWIYNMVSSGAYVEYYLNTTVNIFGYDITAINTYGGYSDPGRDAQQYAMSYSLVGDASWIAYDSVDYNPEAAQEFSAILVAWSMNLTGVDAIKIQWADPVENGAVGMSEIDVIGTATIPEPATMLLLGLGTLAALKKKK